jgi:hypothetical protein
MRTTISLVLSAFVLACNAPAGDAPVPTWTLVEDLRIGGADSGPASLSEIKEVAFDRHGSLWILENKEQQLRIFDRRGDHVRTIGRIGEGPGEIRQVNGFALTGDGKVWLPDHGLRRFTLIDTAGGPVASHANLIQGYRWLWSGVVDTAGRVTEEISVRVDTTYRSAVRRFRDGALAAADTIMLPSCGASGPFYRLNAKNGYSIMSVPYSPMPRTALAADGTWWCADGGRFGVFGIDLATGDTVVNFEFAGTRLAVDAAARDSQIERIRQTAREMGAPEPDFSLIPQIRPAVIGIAIDDAGRIWLQTPTADGTRYEVVDRRGSRVASVTTPLRLGDAALIGFRGDTLAALTFDEDDVPHVVRLHIDRGAARE